MIRLFTVLLILINSFALLAQEDSVELEFSDEQEILASKYTRADSLRGGLSPLREAIDVQHYDLNLKFDIDNRTISGYNEIEFKGVLFTDRFQLDLFEELNIESVIYNNALLPFEREGRAFYITMPEQMQKGKKYVVRINYSGKPVEAKLAPWDGGFVWKKTPSGKPWVGVACEGFGASSWYPCKDHLSDEPDKGAKITLTVPDSLQAISNGRHTDTQNDDNGWASYSWKVTYPINNYNITFYIADYAHFSDFHVNGNDTLTLDYYVLPENVEKAKKQFQQVHKTLKAFEHYFGKYPFYRDGYKLVESPYLGMEHQSAIAYGNKYLPGYMGKHLPGIDFDYIIVHESGHEWWGNNVSMKDVADMWIHEGFCTYSEVLYVEYYQGKDTAQMYVNNMKKRVGNETPIIGDYDVNSEGSGDMYNKGALMLHTLRSWVNDDERFFNLLRSIQSVFALQTVSTIQIENYMSKELNMKLRPFFNQYLRTAELPMLDYYFEGIGKTQQLFYKWTAISGFNMPVRVMLEKDKWTTIYPFNMWQSVHAPIKQKFFKFDKERFYFDTSVK
jgi:aminopeptidase N